MSSTTESEVDALIDHLDGRDTEQHWNAVRRLRELFGDDLPSVLLDSYRSQTQWRRRNSYLYHAIGYARRNDDAVSLGKLAVGDRSKMVRYRACMLLAYSLRQDLLPFLEEQLAKTKDEETREDLIAAMDAIVEQNHNYFADRDHSGMVKLIVE